MAATIKTFPSSGTLSLLDVANKMASIASLNTMAGNLYPQPTTPYRFPDDFYGQAYFHSGNDLVKNYHDGSFSASVTTYGTYTVTGGNSWLTVSPTSGTATGALSIGMIVEKNTGMTSRSTTIILTNTHLNISGSFTVTQENNPDITFIQQLSTGVSKSSACSNNNYANYYTDTSSWYTSLKLWLDPNKTTFAPTGYYGWTDGTGKWVKYWNKATETMDSIATQC